MPVLEESQCNSKIVVKSGRARFGAELSFSLIMLNAIAAADVHWKDPSRMQLVRGPMIALN